jgi:hypothetical protein
MGEPNINTEVAEGQSQRRKCDAGNRGWEIEWGHEPRNANGKGKDEFSPWSFQKESSPANTLV